MPIAQKQILIYFRNNHKEDQCEFGVSQNSKLTKLNFPFRDGMEANWNYGFFMEQTNILI